jgi:hypothetical protein
LTNRPYDRQYREHTGHQIQNHPADQRASKTAQKVIRVDDGTARAQPGNGVGFERSLNAGGTCASG